MSEFWVSRPKWTCKYCNITINDDVPSKTQHLNGMRHKNAVERALRDVYKKSERERNDRDKMQREMKRIEREALRAHRADLEREPPGPAAAASSAAASSSSASTAAPPSAPETPAWKPKDKFSAYSTAASLGFGFEVEGEQKAREELDGRERKAAEERERREKEGQPGKWEVVMPAPRPRVVEEAVEAGGWSDRSNTLGASSGSSSLAQASTSTPANGDPSTQGTQRKGAFLSERVLDHSSDEEEGGLSQIRVKKRIKVDPSSAAPGGGVDRRALPLGQPVKLEMRPAGAAKNGTTAAPKEEGEGRASSSTQVKEEGPTSEGEARVKLDPEAGDDAPSADAAAATSSSSSGGGGGGGGLFKKRKAGAGAGAKRIGQLH